MLSKEKIESALFENHLACRDLKTSKHWCSFAIPGGSELHYLTAVLWDLNIPLSNASMIATGLDIEIICNYKDCEFDGE